jgi:hypothetical protein
MNVLAQIEPFGDRSIFDTLCETSTTPNEAGHPIRYSWFSTRLP